VFHAARGTELSVNTTDTEAPTCSTEAVPYTCGQVRADLYDSQGADTFQGTNYSQPNNGITVPASFSYTIGSTGTYYLVISGFLGQDANQNPTRVPYSLSVTASPNVQWPPPAVPCTVPSFRVGASLPSVERRILAAHCGLGTVTHAYSRHVRRGKVLALSPESGTQLASGSAVAITVSAGRKHVRKH
jgi:hypothetical protein